MSQQVHEQWQTGDRSELELALVRALKIHGVQDNHEVRKQVRVWSAEMQVLFQFLILFFCRNVNLSFLSMYAAFFAGGISVAAHQNS